MKNIDYYLNLPYKLEIIPDTEEGGYIASYPELPGCLTCAETMENIMSNARDALRAWIESALESHIEIPEPESAAVYSGQFKLRIPKSLHKSLALHSKMEGVSLNQYCVYLLSSNDAKHTRDKKDLA